MIDLNKAKNEFLGIVAHDLKNPLASINMSATLISSYHDKMGKEDIIKRSNDIQTTANRMNELIKNLLDINRLETGKFTINLSEVSINEVINEIVTNFITYSQSKNIEVKFNFEKEYIVNSDKDKLFQILENLISNAIKYSPQGKIVKIQFSIVDSFTRISVIDDGPGLSDEDKSKLFEKFTRLSAKPTGGENSTGLGLSIVKKLAQAIGGNVGCNSELGAGSEFYVDLPNSKI
ncbi:MAG: HAMP domain-containing sensor histidine kinase [Candidatus Kapabacteria bacterium]|nr:HAMP domain-containing sensor histidine kinase [Candidatus Kapabacteria bacterium]